MKSGQLIGIPLGQIPNVFVPLRHILQFLSHIYVPIYVPGIKWQTREQIFFNLGGNDIQAAGLILAGKKNNPPSGAHGKKLDYLIIQILTFRQFSLHFYLLN